MKTVQCLHLPYQHNGFVAAYRPMGRWRSSRIFSVIMTEYTSSRNVSTTVFLNLFHSHNVHLYIYQPLVVTTREIYMKTQAVCAKCLNVKR